MDNLLSPAPMTPKMAAPGDAPMAHSGPTTSPSGPLKPCEPGQPIDADLAARLDRHSLEAIVELKISRFLDQIGSFYPDDLHDLIMRKVEKPLLSQILRRTGGNQVHASRILGINRNTLRKKMKLYGFST